MTRAFFRTLVGAIFGLPAHHSGPFRRAPSQLPSAALGHLNPMLGFAPDRLGGLHAAT
jgi:hypothetical protein